jgi:hypothetical protein
VIVLDDVASALGIDELIRHRNAPSVAVGAGMDDLTGGLLRGNQDARTASIWMRKCRRMRDGRRA